MGLALEPGKKLPVYLDYDMAKPEAERPVFYASAPSLRRQLEIGEAFDAIFNETDKAGYTMKDFGAELCDLLSMAYCDWANQVNAVTGAEITFDQSRWSDVLTLEEAKELALKALSLGRVPVSEKKS